MFIVFLAATRFHLSMGMVLVLWIVLHISKIFFTLPGGVLSDKIGRRPIIISGWIMYALVYLGFAFANPDAQWQFWALILAYGFYYGMTEGVEKALVADFVPSERRGTAFGLHSAALGIAALPANLLFGVIWNWVETRYSLDPWPWHWRQGRVLPRRGPGGARLRSPGNPSGQQQAQAGRLK